MKQIILETKMLTNPIKGIYTKTLYYNDGSIEKIEVPEGPILHIPDIVNFEGTGYTPEEFTIPTDPVSKIALFLCVLFLFSYIGLVLLS